jgi:hypothetical protein
MWGLSHVHDALIFMERCVPWQKMVRLLNTLSRSGVVDSRVQPDEFPPQHRTACRFPEDCPVRRLIWSRYYVPADFFEGQILDEDEQGHSLPIQVRWGALQSMTLAGVRHAIARYAYTATECLRSLQSLASWPVSGSAPLRTMIRSQ